MVQAYEAKIEVGRYEWRTFRGGLAAPPLPAEGVRALLDVSPKANRRTYDAFAEKPQLYAELATLKRTEPKILEFANRYGWPSNADQHILRGPKPIYPLRAFRKEHKAFQRVFDMWRSLDPRKLKMYGVSMGLDLTDALQRHNVRPRMEMDGLDQPWPSFGVTSLRLWIGADSVFAAAWLQLALAISDQKQIGQCDECRALFELKPKRLHQRRYCSDKCKMKHHRRTS